MKKQLVLLSFISFATAFVAEAQAQQTPRADRRENVRDRSKNRRENRRAQRIEPSFPNNKHESSRIL